MNMNNEILVFDTESDIVKHERIDPFPLFGEDNVLLGIAVPEYEDTLPNPQMTRMVDRLKMTMKLYGGIGLAANQCGISARLFVIGTDQFQIACINPKIISRSAEVTKMPEGCLSFPGLYVNIERNATIDVEYTLENGEVKRTTMQGVTAHCFQHELEHLDGKMFIDHVKPLALQMARKKQSKIVKKVKRNKK